VGTKKKNEKEEKTERQSQQGANFGFPILASEVGEGFLNPPKGHGKPETKGGRWEKRS